MDKRDKRDKRDMGILNFIHPENYLSKINDYSHFREGRSNPKIFKVICEIYIV